MVNVDDAAKDDGIPPRHHEMGIRLIDQLLEFGEPYPALLLTGADPRMRADVFELLRHAKEKGICTAVAASVTPLLTREKLEQMRDLGVEIISISMDGASAEIHDKIRDIPGTWRATLDAIELSTSCGMRLQVNTTVMKSNLRDLADIFHLAGRGGAVAWEVFFLIRTGRGSSLENPERSECEEVAHFLYDATRYGIPGSVKTESWCGGENYQRLFCNCSQRPGDRFCISQVSQSGTANTGSGGRANVQPGRRRLWRRPVSDDRLFHLWGDDLLHHRRHGPKHLFSGV